MFTKIYIQIQPFALSFICPDDRQFKPINLPPVPENLKENARKHTSCKTTSEFSAKIQLHVLSAQSGYEKYWVD